MNPSNFAEQKNNPNTVSAAGVSVHKTYEVIMSHKPEAMQPTQSIDQSPQPIASASALTETHHQHLLDEGFTEAQISDYLLPIGVRSIDLVTANSKGFRLKDASGTYRSSSGLYFPFTKTFGQIRADVALTNAQGKAAKYLTPIGAKSEAMLPDGCKVITEGFKDAIAGSLHGGIPTGALAGVSHAFKALEPGSGYTILFDADGWTNPNVFRSLITAGVHLKGKIQLVPTIEGEPKAGLCEYFKAGHTAADYQALVGSAMSIAEFLLALPQHWSGLSEVKALRCVEVAIALAATHLSESQRSKFLDKIAATKILSRTELGRLLAKRVNLQSKRKEKRRQKAEQADRVKQQGRIPANYNRYTGEMEAPESSTVAAILSEAYRSEIAFDVATGQFYRYGSEMRGVWSIEPLPFIQAMTQAELDASGLQDCYDSRYVSSIISLMQGRLAVRRWDQARGLLPLQNGVLDLATRKLLDHSPGYRFTWQLPYEYDAAATCEPIVQWMRQAQDNDEQRVQLLRAYLKAIVCGRADLQRFVECLGPGGTGKSTYTNLAIALVGVQNTHSTTLKQLEENRFETAAIRGKKLIIINDSERYGGSVSILKAMTGQDMIRDEQKYRQTGNGFVTEGMVLIAANEPIQSSDYTSGLERRRLTIPFLNQIAPEQRRDLLTITHLGASGEFVFYLPGLLNWVLALPDHEMRSLILHTHTSVPSLARWKAESLIESNPIAEWLDGHLIIDPTAKTYVGVARKVRETTGEPGNTTSREYWENAEKWLYPSYVQCCHDLGNRPISVKRFVNLLEDLLRSQLKLSACKWRDEKGSYFQGVAIRSKQHDDIKRPISGEFAADGQNLTADLTEHDGKLTAETIDPDAFDGSDGFLELACQKEKLKIEKPSEGISVKPVSSPAAIKEQNPSDPSNPSGSVLPAVSHPVRTAATESSNPSEIRIGDRVRYVGADFQLNSYSKGIAKIINESIAVIEHPSSGIRRQIPIADLRPIA